MSDQLKKSRLKGRNNIHSKIYSEDTCERTKTMHNQIISDKQKISYNQK